MKKLFAKVYYITAVIILFVGASLSANAQYTSRTISSNSWASIAARDASGNLYVVEAATQNGASDNGKVLKYTNGTGVPTVIYSGSGLPFDNCDGQQDDAPFGLAVTSNGDVYVTTTTDYFATNCSPLYGNIIKLTYNSGNNTYTESTFLAGTPSFGAFTSLAVDANDNLFCLLYDASGNGGAITNSGLTGSYEIEEFPQSGGIPQVGSKFRIAAGDALKLYVNALNSSDNYSNINGLAIDPSGNIYVADPFDSSGPAGTDGGHVYKLTKSGGSYTSSTFTSGQYTAGIASDLSGNIYTTNDPSDGTSYMLVEYAGGSSGSPQTLYSSLGVGGPELFYPVGIVPISSTNIFVCNGSTGGTNNGDLLQLFGPPTTQATNVTFSNTTSTTTTASWTNGNGTSRAVFIKQTNTGNPVPVNSTAYTANVNYASGSQVGGWYCIYNGTGTTVNITGLATGQTYRVMAVEYTGIPGSSDENYLQSAGTNNPNNVTASAGETVTFTALPVKTYGDADFSPGATSTNGAVAITYASDNPAVATIVSGNIHIVGQGTAHITASQAGDGSHSAAADVVQLLTVNKASLTITVDNQTKAYGAAVPTLTASYSGFVNSETSAILTTLPTLSTPATTSSHVAGNPYAITASGAAADNYAISYVAGSLTVNAVALTITADNQTKAYGAAIPTLTASYNGFVNGDTEASLTTMPTLSTPAVTASHVAGNPYPITPSGAVDADYNISYVAGTLTIGTASLTITADNQTKAYGAAIPTLTASYNGFVNGDTEASLTTMPTLSTTAVTASHVAGNPYPITPSGAVDADYSISYVAGTLTVGTASLTITADNQTKAYGAAVPTLTASYNGFVNGDTEASLTTQPTLSTIATSVSPVSGSPYLITPSGAVDADYSISYVAGSLVIGKAAIAIAADAKTKNFGAADPALTYTITSGTLYNGDTFTGALSRVAGETAGNYAITQGTLVLSADYNLSYTGANLTISPAVLLPETITFNPIPAKTYGNADFAAGATSDNNNVAITYGSSNTAVATIIGTNIHIVGAGTAIITASQAGDAGHTSASDVQRTLTVNKASATISLANLSATYDGTGKSATATTNPAGLSGITFTYDGSATAPTAAGTYAVVASLTNANYTAANATGNLTIDKATATISLSNLAATYDGTVKSATATTNPAGLSGVTLTYDGSATAPTNAGTYAVVASLTNTNYTAADATGNLVIGKATATISLAGLTATYDGAAKSATATTNPAGLSGVTLTYDGSATAPTNAGTYAVVASLTNTNYTAANATGNLVIGKASATINLAGLTATYDRTSKSATATTNPAGLSGVTFTYDGSATAPTNAGTYAVIASLTNTNYTASNATGNLVIGKAGIAIAADAKTKNFGAADPALTYTITSGTLYNGDTFTGALSRVAGETAGNYAITQGTLVLSADYNLSYTGANLTISPAVLLPETITFNPIPAKTYGNADFAAGATSDNNNVAITYGSSNTAVATIIGTNIHIVGAGTTIITASQAGDAGHTSASDVQRTLTVNKASATISLAGLTATYEGTAKSATATTNPAGLSGVTFTYDGSATAPTAAGTYAVVASLTNANYTAANATGNLTIDKATATISLSNLAATYDGTAKSATATTNPAGLSGVTLTYDGSATAPTNAGTYAVVASLTNANYTASNATGNLTIGKASTTISLAGLTATYDGTAKSATATTNPAGLSGLTLTYDGSATAPTGAGTYAVVASLTNANYTAADATGNLVISKASATISLASLTATYDGTAKSATATTNPAGLSGVTITYDGSATVPTNAGTYAVVVSLTNANYTAADATGNLVIGKASATISFSNLTATYDGTAKSATATTNPAGLSGVTITYDGSATAPTAAGSYAVVASLTNTNYTAADATGNLVIGKASATISLAGLTATYDGTAKSATATTNPAGLSGVTLTYDGSATAPTAAGIYAVVASLTNTNYTAADATGNLVIGKVTATISLSNLTATYDGTAKSATATTNPAGLSGVTITYDGSTTAPTNAGTYAVVASLANANYTAANATGSLTINKTTVTLTLSNLTATYDGTAKSATAITNPVALSGVTLTYDGSATAPTAAGSYAVVASLTNANYTAADATGNLVIGKASTTISLAGLAASYDGTAKSATATTNPTGLSGVTITYDGSATVPTNAGTYAVVASLTNANYTAADASGNLVIGKGTATISLANLNQTYDGTAKSATATTNPAGLSGVTLTYDGSATMPSAAGTYAVVASLTNANYTAADASGNLVIDKGTATITLAGLTASYDGTAKSATATTNPAGLSGVTLSYDGSATAPTAAGTYAVVASLTNSSYSAANATGTLVIDKRSVTVTAATKTKTYGDADPALTYTISSGSLVGTDTFTGALSRAPGEAAGSYAITQGTLALNANYDLGYIGANLVIGLAAETITFNVVPVKTYGDGDFAAGATSNNSGPAITYASSNTAVATIVGTKIHIIAAGTTTITASQAGDANHSAAADVSQALTVNKAVLTITAGNATRIYGIANPAFTVAYNGFVNGDTQASLTSLATATTTATATSAVGAYDIIPAGAVSASYSFNYVSGKLTITTATRTLTFNPIQAKTYGDADFNAGATASTGEAIIYSGYNPAVVTIVNGKIHITGAGTTTITATVAASGNYSNTPSRSQTLTVNKANQQIAFSFIPVQLKGTTYDLSQVITASSGLPVSFTSSDDNIATVSGSILSALHIGKTTITATQAGNANYNAAAEATGTVTVNDQAGDDIVVHQAVSPNSDGINDYLYIEGINNYPQNSVVLFNRNGVLIWEGSGYDNGDRRFDGHSNETGALQQAGTYFYKIEYIANGEKKHKTGYFILKY